MLSLSAKGHGVDGRRLVQTKPLIKATSLPVWELDGGQQIPEPFMMSCPPSESEL